MERGFSCMCKKTKTFRLSDETINNIEFLRSYFSDQIKLNFNSTNALEYAINKMAMKYKQEENDDQSPTE